MPAVVHVIMHDMSTAECSKLAPDGDIVACQRRLLGLCAAPKGAEGRRRAPKGAEGRRRRSLWPPVSALGAGLLASPSLATLPRSRTQADRDCRLRALRGAHRAPRPGGAGELPGRVARAGWPLPPPPCAAARPTAHLRGRELRAGTWAGACVCTCPVGFLVAKSARRSFPEIETFVLHARVRGNGGQRPRRHAGLPVLQHACEHRFPRACLQGCQRAQSTNRGWSGGGDPGLCYL